MRAHDGDVNVTPDAESTAETSTPARSKPRWMPLAAVAVGSLVVSGIVGALVIANNDDSSTYAASQIGWMHDGCQQWADNDQAADDPDAASSGAGTPAGTAAQSADA